ncbi:MAG: hypothetical protein ACT4OM_12320 [Actinomycetota bacterium]
MTHHDPTLNRIKDAMRLFHRAERQEARSRLLTLWDELGEESDEFHRCVLAHYMADTQDDPLEELAWDRRALEVAETVSRDRQDPTASAVRAFFPSLHLNLADGYRRMGDFDQARRHVEQGIQDSGVLSFDAYGQNVRAGLNRVEAQIEDQNSGPAVIFDTD